jgi:mono/diheme cytochrome c family protein
MTKTSSFILAAAIAAAGGTAAAGERVGDFALIDHKGTFQSMAWHDDSAAIAILPQAVGATDTASLAEMQALQAKYQEQGIEFFLLNPGLQTDRAAVAADIGSVDMPVLMDDAQLVSEMLGLTRLDEALLYNPSTFELLYRGPAAGIESAIEQTLAGEKFDLISTATMGKAIDYRNVAAHADLSYANDIAPIIAENCAECHREGGIAPFAMDNSLAVQGWSPMIREVVMTKRMPPGQIDNKVGHKIKNEMNLSDDEMQMLVHWINNGSVVEGDSDPLTALTWPNTKWTLGEPDLIVKVPAQTIPPTGTVDYMDIPIDLGLTEDRWVRGSEVVPGAPSVLHHIITTVVPPEGAPDFQQILMDILAKLPPEKSLAIRTKLFASIAAGERPDIDAIFREAPEIDVSAFIGGGSSPDSASVAGFAPGNAVDLNPEGVGGLLRAGSTLNLQMHYTTSGKETTDETEIGIYFYPEGYVPDERMGGGVGNAFSINIPAQAKDHEMQLVTYVPEEAEIFSLMPHMHFRGKRMSFTAEYPDGGEELLLSVPAYSFNWQLKHELAEPLRVPAGTKIVATGAFDNSAQNPYNPDPSTEVTWGEQSWEEMFMGFYTWKNVEQGGSE